MIVPVKGGVGAGRLKGFGVITALGAPGVPRICCAPAPALAISAAMNPVRAMSFGRRMMLVSFVLGFVFFLCNAIGQALLGGL
jgi:hypothetical protein